MLSLWGNECIRPVSFGIGKKEVCNNIRVCVVNAKNQNQLNITCFEKCNENKSFSRIIINDRMLRTSCN